MKYFVSYAYCSDRKTGFGSCVVDNVCRLNSYDDVNTIRDLILKSIKEDLGSNLRMAILSFAEITNENSKSKTRRFKTMI